MIRCVITTVLLGAVIAMAGCSQRVSEQTDSNPKYPAALTCFIGEIGSGTNCSMVITDPREKVTKSRITGEKMTCGHPGEVSEIGWKFISHQDNKDVYTFTRVYPADGNEREAESKTVAFDGSQLVLFEDDHHVVVLHTPED